MSLSRFHRLRAGLGAAWCALCGLPALAHEMPGAESPQPPAAASVGHPTANSASSPAASPAASPADTARDPLPGLVAMALERNQALLSAEWEVKARHSGPEHVWSLPPPEVGVEFYQGPARDFPNPLKNQQEIDYSVEQAFPFPGTLAARIRAEHGHAEAAEAELEALRRKTAREAKAGYYAAWLAARRLDINARSRSLLERVIAIARRQYEVGLGTQADILRAQAEATRLRMDSADREQERAAALADLNALLDREPGAPIRVADSVEPYPQDVPYARLAAALEAAHPDLKAKSAEIRMRQAESDLARRGYWPGFKIGAAYKDMLAMPPGTHGGALRDYWSLGVSMDLPAAFWSLPRARAGAEQARYRVEQARADLASVRNAALARARAAAERAKALRERLRLGRESLLPQARQAHGSALAAYQGGKGDFASVLDAARAVLAAEDGVISDLAALLAGQADLEEAAGMDWEALALPREGNSK
jgi:cobalt-zinc-cadmium efflux system outer membrane protein